MALPPPPPAGMAGVAAPPDLTAGAGPDPDAGSDETVVCTITKTADGGYKVYAGDEPEDDDGGADMSEDDADAMGGAGMGAGGTGSSGSGAGGDSASAGAGGSPGQPASSIGAALKEAMTILQADASSAGAPGSADDQFTAGFGASKAPTPVGMGGAA
jgi:hypothetical protein